MFRLIIYINILCIFSSLSYGSGYNNNQLPSYGITDNDYYLQLARMSKEEVPKWNIFGVGSIKDSLFVVSTKATAGKYPIVQIVSQNNETKVRYSIEKIREGLYIADDERQNHKLLHNEKSLSFRIYHFSSKPNPKFLIDENKKIKKSPKNIKVSNFKIWVAGGGTVLNRWIKDPRDNNKYALLIISSEKAVEPIDFYCRDGKCDSGQWNGSCGSIRKDGKEYYIEGIGQYLFEITDQGKVSQKNSCYKFLKDHHQKSFSVTKHGLVYCGHSVQPSFPKACNRVRPEQQVSEKKKTKTAPPKKKQLLVDFGKIPKEVEQNEVFFLLSDKRIKLRYCNLRRAEAEQVAYVEESKQFSFSYSEIQNLFTAQISKKEKYNIDNNDKFALAVIKYKDNIWCEATRIRQVSRLQFRAEFDFSKQIDFAKQPIIISVTKPGKCSNQVSFGLVNKSSQRIKTITTQKIRYKFHESILNLESSDWDFQAKLYPVYNQEFYKPETTIDNPDSALINQNRVLLEHSGLDPVDKIRNYKLVIECLPKTKTLMVAFHYTEDAIQLFNDQKVDKASFQYDLLQENTEVSVGESGLSLKNNETGKYELRSEDVAIAGIRLNEKDIKTQSSNRFSIRYKQIPDNDRILNIYLTPKPYELPEKATFKVLLEYGEEKVELPRNTKNRNILYCPPKLFFERGSLPTQPAITRDREGRITFDLTSLKDIDLYSFDILKINSDKKVNGDDINCIKTDAVSGIQLSEINDKNELIVRTSPESLTGVLVSYLTPVPGSSNLPLPLWRKYLRIYNRVYKEVWYAGNSTPIWNNGVLYSERAKGDLHAVKKSNFSASLMDKNSIEEIATKGQSYKPNISASFTDISNILALKYSKVRWNTIFLDDKGRDYVCKDYKDQYKKLKKQNLNKALILAVSFPEYASNQLEAIGSIEENVDLFKCKGTPEGLMVLVANGRSIQLESEGSAKLLRAMARESCKFFIGKESQDSSGC